MILGLFGAESIDAVGEFGVHIVDLVGEVSSDSTVGIGNIVIDFFLEKDFLSGHLTSNLSVFVHKHLVNHFEVSSKGFQVGTS